MKPILIKSGRIVDPAQGIDRVSDLLLKNGTVSDIGHDLSVPNSTQVIHADGHVVSPGFIDLHCHLRDPGFEYKETIATGTAAAVRGGFTTVCAMPNTNPVADTRSVFEYVRNTSRELGSARVLPIGCITKGSKGLELSEMGELADAGAIGFSDDGLPVVSPSVMRQALSYSSTLGLPVINHCEVPELAAEGTMNDGWIATRLGLVGIPNSAEDVMVARDIKLTELTGGRLHIPHASTAGTIELVRDAKKRGLPVTCEVTPHHLTLTDAAVLGFGCHGDVFKSLTAQAYDTSAKVAPPLRSGTDRQAMVDALCDGTIDLIATDHAPHGSIDKLCSFGEAANGISVLETALGSLMSLVHSDDVTLPTMIKSLTSTPAAFLGMNLGTLRKGYPADVTIVDTDSDWIVDPEDFASKGKNTPLSGMSLKGKVLMTIFGGRIVYEASS